MTTDVDKMMAETLAGLESATAYDESKGLLDVIALARALVETRKDLAETRRLVDAMAGPMETGKVRFRDPRPLSFEVETTPTVEYVQKLRAAVAEVLSEWCANLVQVAKDRDQDVPAATVARIDELEKLL